MQGCNSTERWEAASIAKRLGMTQETHGGVNVGGGLKIVLAGPLRLRVDYRVFTLRGNPSHSTPQRIYTGLNLAF